MEAVARTDFSPAKQHNVWVGDMWTENWVFKGTYNYHSTGELITLNSFVLEVLDIDGDEFLMVITSNYYIPNSPNH
jgi:hypothetical protein